MSTTGAHGATGATADVGGPHRARSEMLRKAIHVGCGFWALLLRFVSWPVALVLALAALLFGGVVSPRVLGHWLHRPGERVRGWSPAIAFYALSVVALVLIFRERLEYVAAGWALMAFGDGAATLVGIPWGRRPLPWCRAKTWEGLLAHVVVGALAAAALFAWVAPPERQPAGGIVLAACLAAAALTALLETHDSGVDDNLVVPLAGAGFTWLFVAVMVAPSADGPLPSAGRAIAALLACSVLAAVSWWRKALSVSGALASVLVGTVVAGAGGWGAFAVLLAFFLLGTWATRMGREIKEQRGIAEARGGRRAVGNVLANGGMAAACALLVGAWRDAGMLGEDHVLHVLGWVALAGALATATFDTVSSEIGKAWGRRTILLTTLRPAPPGTPGAISLEGTLAGAFGALVLASVAGVAGAPLGRAGVLAVVIGALVGTTFESVVGSLSASHGVRIGGDFRNFANTVVGGLCAAGLHALLA